MSNTPTWKTPHHAAHQRRKRRGRRKLAAVLVLLALLAGAWVFLSEYVVFTSEGIRFSFGEDAVSDTADRASAPFLSDAGQDNAPQISIDRGELPPEGAGPVHGSLLEVAGLSREEILSAAVNLKNLGYTAAVVPVKTASAPRIDAQELSWAAEACETADLRLIPYLSCFRDDVTARAQPSLAVCDAEGALFVDYDYSAWLNPYEEAARDAVLADCRFAVSGGADELLLDNLSFPNSGNLAPIEYGDVEDSPREVIGAFAALLRETFPDLRLGAVVSGDDLFGEGASETKGQDVSLFSATFDRIWAYAADDTEAASLLEKLASLSQEAASQFCVITGRTYESAAYPET